MDTSRKQLAALARQLAATAPEEIDCDAVLDRVAAYLESRQGGDPLSSELQQVGQHLEVCPSCHEEFQVLLKACEGG